MKQAWMIIGGLFMVAFVAVPGYAAHVYELDMTLEMEMHPESGELVKDVPQFMEWTENQTDPEAKEVYQNSAVNSIVVDKMGYKYQVPIKGYVETENGEIKRYRFEHISATVDISSPLPTANRSSPTMNFKNIFTMARIFILKRNLCQTTRQ